MPICSKIAVVDSRLCPIKSKTKSLTFWSVPYERLLPEGANMKPPGDSHIPSEAFEF
jgi:hypothetical protein